MAAIVFFQKPGCGTNARQIAMLERAGYRVDARNLLSEPWTPERLLGFFGDTPVTNWFNPAAPRVKSGEILPERLDAVSALALMIADPLLIRRPLVERGTARCAGFDREPVTSWLRDGDALKAVQGCTRPEAPGGCPTPEPSAARA
ncbi:MAG: arsenate reductase family protein [Rhizobiales bacterium 24-66-13]|nr:MAG: arsenate reductase family protein [Rhizobiales bacterium 24-66-13]HQS10670.1 ArsC/Spx/MgsR family protein [Xanthobacteraceae bacterium]HQS50146.1 ArsC/Spx/MgsR family protein [Xanthobacteraceae bacterium]